MGKIAGFLTERLLVYNLIEESEQELYQYGIERLLSKLINYSVFFVVAFCIGKVIPTVLFLSFLFLLRGRTGGYHASTELRCFVSSLAIYVAMMEWGIPLLVQFPVGKWSAFGIAIVIIYMWAPVNHPNVDFSTEELAQYRLRARRVLVIESGLILLMQMMQIREEYIANAISAVMVCSILVGLAKITKQEV